MINVKLETTTFTNQKNSLYIVLQSHKITTFKKTNSR